MVVRYTIKAIVFLSQLCLNVFGVCHLRLWTVEVTLFHRLIWLYLCYDNFGYKRIHLKLFDVIYISITQDKSENKDQNNFEM